MNLEDEEARLLEHDSLSIPKRTHTAKDLDGSQLPRYMLVSLCGLCIGVSYCDRVNLSVAIVAMAKESDWDITEKGKILSGFFYGYIVSQIMGAVLSRKVGGEWVLGVCAFGWSTATVLVPLAASFGTTVLLMNRVIVGLFEGVAFPVVYHLFALNVPEQERSRSVSVISVNVSLGAVFAFYFSPILIYRSSWQTVFYFFGALGWVWVIIWAIFWSYNHFHGFKVHDEEFKARTFKLKAKEPRISNGILRSSAQNTEVSKTITDIIKLLKHNVVLAVLWCHFCHNIGHYVILSWLPTFLDSLGVKGEDLSITCVPYLLMACFAVAFGAAADKMIKASGFTKDDDSDELLSGIRRFWTVALFLSSAATLVLMTMFIPSGHEADTATPETHAGLLLVIVFLSLALGLNSSCPVAGYESAKLDLIEQNKVGLLQGTSNSFASLSGVIGVPIVGFIHTMFDSWTPVFFWIAFMFCSAAFVFHKYGRWDKKIAL